MNVYNSGFKENEWLRNDNLRSYTVQVQLPFCFTLQRHHTKHHTPERV